MAAGRVFGRAPAIHCARVGRTDRRSGGRAVGMAPSCPTSPHPQAVCRGPPVLPTVPVVHATSNLALRDLLPADPVVVRRLSLPFDERLRAHALLLAERL